MNDETTLAGAQGGAPLDAQGDRASLVLFHHGQLRVAELVRHEALTIGRQPPANLIIADPSLSREHVRFDWREDGIYATDLGSRNGTWFEGQRVREARLFAGARLVVGGVTVAVQMTPPSEVVQYGVEGHAGAQVRLEEEVARARAYRRPLSALLLGSRQGHVTSFCAQVRAQLGRFATVGVYGPGTLLVVLPEANQADARAQAAELVRRCPTVALRCGVATFPSAGTYADKLLARAFAAYEQADGAHPVRCAGEDEADDGPAPSAVVAESPAMRQLFQLVERVADADLAVLVVGETGSGKEVVAQHLHRASRRTGPLRVLNCAAIPPNLTESVLFGHQRGAFTGAERDHKGVFEEADGGTVFLDELGELPLDAQASLLRVLETKRVTRVGGRSERAVDVRLVAATHQDLEALVAQGRFRRDLLHRVNALTLEVPPLRARPEELAPLVTTFLAEIAARRGVAPLRLAPETLHCLRAHSWPGNVRELRNVIERGVALAQGPHLEPADLPPQLTALHGPSCPAPPTEGTAAAQPLTPNMDYRTRVADFERQLLQRALDQTGGTSKEAAALLGLPRRTFDHKLRALGLRNPGAR